MKFGVLDQQTLVGVIQPQPDGLSVYTAPAGRLVGRISRATSFAFSSTCIYVLADETLSRYSLDLDSLEKSVRLQHTQTSVSASSGFLATATATNVYLHDTVTFAETHRLESAVFNLSHRFLVYSSRAPASSSGLENWLVVLDLPSDTKHSHFKAHNNQISCVRVNHLQTLFVSASSTGTCFRVWEMSGPDRTPDCIYKLERGYTPSLTSELLFSPDSTLIMASTSARGTRHIFSIEPIPPSRSPPGRGSQAYALAQLNGQLDDIPAQSQTRRSLDHANSPPSSNPKHSPIARIRPDVTTATTGSTAVDCVSWIQDDATVYTLASPTRMDVWALQQDETSTSELLFSTSFPRSAMDWTGGIKAYALVETIQLGRAGCVQQPIKAEPQLVADETDNEENWVSGIEMATGDPVSGGMDIWKRRNWTFSVFQHVGGATTSTTTTTTSKKKKQKATVSTRKSQELPASVDLVVPKRLDVADADVVTGVDEKLVAEAIGQVQVTDLLIDDDVILSFEDAFQVE